jgi:hypothetical protein
MLDAVQILALIAKNPDAYYKFREDYGFWLHYVHALPDQYNVWKAITKRARAVWTSEEYIMIEGHIYDYWYEDEHVRPCTNYGT